MRLIPATQSSTPFHLVVNGTALAVLWVVESAGPLKGALVWVKAPIRNDRGVTSPTQGWVEVDEPEGGFRFQGMKLIVAHMDGTWTLRSVCVINKLTATGSYLD